MTSSYNAQKKSPTVEVYLAAVESALVPEKFASHHEMAHAFAMHTGRYWDSMNEADPDAVRLLESFVNSCASGPEKAAVARYISQAHMMSAMIGEE